MSSAFFFLNKLSLEKKFTRKVERLNVNSVDPDETDYMSRLIWINDVCKSLLSLPVALKELKQKENKNAKWALADKRVSQ